MKIRTSMLKTGDKVTTIRPLKVTITRIGMQDAIGSMTLSPGTFTVEDFAFDEDIFGWIDLNVPGLESVIITAKQEDFEDACYNESDWERDNAHILNHPDNPDNKE
jgi:hypothetical protein